MKRVHIKKMNQIAREKTIEKDGDAKSKLNSDLVYVMREIDTLMRSLSRSYDSVAIENDETEVSGIKIIHASRLLIDNGDFTSVIKVLFSSYAMQRTEVGVNHV